MSIGTTSNMEWLVGNGGSGAAEYTAGHGIDIDNVDHIISVDQSEIQDKLTAGEGITIVNNVISANPQRQSDWAQTDTEATDYIRNKPTIPTKTSDLTNDTGYITSASLPSQSQLVPEYTLPEDNGKVLTAGSTTHWTTIPSQVQSDWTESDSSDPAYIANKPTLATVATSGSYADLSNTPTIPSGDQLVPSATSSDEGKILTVDSNGDPSWAPAQTYSQVQSNWNETDSSAVSYIRNKPTIPTATSDLTNDSNFITASEVPSSQVQADWNESDSSDPAYIANKPTLSTVATSGDYADLSNTPAIPSGNQLLPSATSSDEGKFLGVDSNGDPEWRTLPPVTGGEIFVAEYNVTSYADVVAAYTSGKTVTVKDGDYWAFPSEFQYAATSDKYSFIFTTNYTSWQQTSSSDISISNTHHLFYRLTTDEPGYPTHWFRQRYDNRALPTPSDIGKVLTCEASGTGTVVNWVAPQTFTQVQSNWNESDTTAVSFIQNKPSIPTATSDLTNDSNFITANDVPSSQVQSDWTESNSASAAYIAHKPNLATVATSGSYSDLSGKPTIPSGNQLLPSATSADSGKVLTVDSTGSPEWATGGGSTQVQSNWTEANTSAPAYIKNKPTVKNLIAGTGIRITETSQGIVISLA